MKTNGSVNHELGSYELNKASLSCFDDKRYIHEDGVTIKLRFWTLLHFSRKFYFKNEFYKPKRFSIVQTKFEAYDWLKKKNRPSLTRILGKVPV